MSFKLAEAYAEITTKDAKLNSGLAAAKSKIVGSFKDISNRGQQFGSTMGKVLALGGAVAGVFALKHMISSFAESEYGAMKLRAALQYNGQEVDNNFKSMQGLSRAMAEVLNVGEGESRALMTQALNLGHTADESKEMTKAAVGLAEVVGGDANSALWDLNKAAAGNFMMLERSIPALKRYSTQAEKMAYLDRMVNKGLMERRALMDTTKGRVDAMNMALEHMGKDLGGLVAPAVKSVAEGVTLLTKIMQNSEENATLFAKKYVLAFRQVQLWIAETLGVNPEIRRAMVGQVEDLTTQVSELMAKMTREQIQQDKDATNAKIGNLRAYEKETYKIGGSLDDIWNEAQKKAVEYAERAAVELKAIEDKKASDAAKAKASRPPPDIRAQLQRDKDEYFDLQEADRHMDPNGEFAGARTQRMEKLQRRMHQEEDIVEFGSQGRAGATRSNYLQKKALEMKQQAEEKELADRQLAETQSLQHAFKGAPGTGFEAQMVTDQKMRQGNEMRDMQDLHAQQRLYLKQTSDTMMNTMASKFAKDRDNPVVKDRDDYMTLQRLERVLSRLADALPYIGGVK